jgi:hypothetical protein
VLFPLDTADAEPYDRRMRRAVLLMSLAWVSGCTSGSVFACDEDSECNLGDTPGFCDAPGYCSFDDEACPSGRRYGSLAGMGLADECVPGDGGSSGVGGSTSMAPSTMGTTTTAMTTVEPTSATTEATTEASSDGTATDPTMTSTTTGLDSSGASTGTGPMCTVYDFESDPGFVDLGTFVDVVYDGGQMVVQWDEALLASASLEIADGIDVTGGSIVTEFAALPTDLGTLLSVRWEDTSGRIISADVDGLSYFLGYYDPSLPKGEQNQNFGTAPHQQRALLRMREEAGTVVVEAADVDAKDYEEIGTTGEAFDPVGVQVWMIFNRYQSDGVTTRIALETITTCG